MSCWWLPCTISSCDLVFRKRDINMQILCVNISKKFSVFPYLGLPVLLEVVLVTVFLMEAKENSDRVGRGREKSRLCGGFLWMNNFCLGQNLEKKGTKTTSPTTHSKEWAWRNSIWKKLLRYAIFYTHSVCLGAWKFPLCCCENPERKSLLKLGRS